ncbi:UNVERIFIED_CONTAM: hypothetical protein GTU68_004530 [Idotea baltica]|nr:hypothetical protein [Idotea baltica]
MASFDLKSEYSPQGDQPQAIAKLVKSVNAGNRHQTLLGVTGSGKTFTMANVIAEIGKPTLVMSHNKTLAAQLYSEFKNFFPNNAVEYFVSYFDYYQPEAYIPRTDTYIEKDSSINEEIERLRLSAMSSLLTRKDVLVVASVSCIYGLGSPDDYKNMMIPVKVGMEIDRDEFLQKLVAILYQRNDVAFLRGHFRVRGDVVEVYPAYLDDEAIRVEFFGDEIDRITCFYPLTGTAKSQLDDFTFYPAKQFVTPADKMAKAVKAIREELKMQVEHFEKEQKYLEAQRIKQRTDYDIEMMQEMGFCQGVENYSRHLTGRPEGSRPGTLIDFFRDDFLTVIDESHVSVPQIGGMYEGDRSRKTNLVDFGFRLPSALDNRPLRFPEFMDMTKQIVYVSATPAKFEMKKGTDLIVEQIIRPTGLLDPIITLRPLKGQIDETIEQCQQRIEQNQRILVTTLTKRTAEDLTDYLRAAGLKVRYLHSDIDAIERVEILRDLRAAEFDILVGINLLREGLDLPEVSLVCILDADKEGFLRSETSLIQTAGRAARHVNGEVILFADKVTDSIEKLINITEYRRLKQVEYNEEHGITPTSVIRSIQGSLRTYENGKLVEDSMVAEGEDLDTVTVIKELEEEMQVAAQKLEFERAALIRDQLNELKKQSGEPLLKVKKKRVKYASKVK